MKTHKRTITLFSFFPTMALLGAPLLFSTLAPATSDWTAEDVDSYDWTVPQSRLTMDEILEAENVRNKDIGEVKFLQYDRDYIYMAEDGDENTAPDTDASFNEGEAFRNEPAITDSGEIDTAYVLNNPEFQRQVEEVSAQANQAGASMPPLLTLVALFAFAMATGSATLKEFFKFSTYTEQVKKTIQVTKKVAKTVYRTITETVARKVKTVKQVAYTAYKTNAVQVISPPSVDKLEEMARFMRKTVKENPSFSRPFERNARYYLPNMKDRSEWNNFTIEYGGIAAGTRVGGTVHRLQEYFSSPAHTDVKMSLNTISDYFFEGIRFTEPALYEKLKEEFDAIVKPVTEPIVNSTGKPYTAYRDEVETKTVYDTISREVPETIYEDITEDREITEDVTKHSFTPDDEKIGLAMSYLKNYSRILQNPSNRNFSDDVLTPNKDLSLFAGAYETYKQLGMELKDANIYNTERTNPEEVKRILRKHNEFVYSMKGILERIQQGKTPQEQMEILFGKDYTDSVIANENAIAQAEADEKAISARFEEIEELLRTSKISIGYYRSLYSSAKQNRDQLYRRKRDALKNLKEGKEYYARRFNQTVSSLQNLSFLRNLDDWRATLAYGERAVASRLVPFTTANGSTIYRRANAVTTTQAQPKKTIPQPSQANLQQAGWFKKLFGKDTAKTSKAATEAQKMEFLRYDRITGDEYINTHMEEMVLDRVNRNFPLKNPKNWKWDMGSGYHDGAAYNAVDLNHVSGNDLGLPVSAVAGGVISSISPDVGGVTITHKLGKNTWQSKYLHLLINDLGVKKDSDGIERRHYALIDKNGNTIKEIVEGKTTIKEGEHFAAVGGTKGFSPHLHFEVLLNNQTVDLSGILRDKLSRFTGADAGPDANAKTPDGDREFDVEWNKKLGAWVTAGTQTSGTANPNLVYDRTPQALEDRSNGTTPAHWLAWELDAKGNPISDVSQLKKRVVWKEVDRITVNNKEQGVMRWVKADSSVWIDGDNVWNPNSQSWGNYQR